VVWCGLIWNLIPWGLCAGVVYCLGSWVTGADKKNTSQCESSKQVGFRLSNLPSSTTKHPQQYPQRPLVGTCELGSMINTRAILKAHIASICMLRSLYLTSPQTRRNWQGRGLSQALALAGHSVHLNKSTAPCLSCVPSTHVQQHMYAEPPLHQEYQESKLCGHSCV
jgi:hypothetical protein